MSGGIILTKIKKRATNQTNKESNAIANIFNEKEKTRIQTVKPFTVANLKGKHFRVFNGLLLLQTSTYFEYYHLHLCIIERRLYSVMNKEMIFHMAIKLF